MTCIYTLGSFFHHFEQGKQLFPTTFFPTLCTRETIFVTSCLFPAHHPSNEKGSTLKGKNLFPKGANSFLLEMTTFQKGGNKFWMSCLS